MKGTNNSKLDEIDELLKDTSSAERTKYSKSEVAINAEDFKSDSTDISSNDIDVEINNVADEATEYEDVSSTSIEVQPVKDEAPQQQKPADTEESFDVVADVPNTSVNDTINEPVRIIDETSTSFTMDEEPEISVSELSSSSEAEPEELKEKNKDKKYKKDKKNKEKVKYNALQISIIAVVSVITLWVAVFTVDHILSAQGLTPIFSFKTEEYEDGSISYKGAGYKTQFQFDANGNLTQKCVPFWKDGPNDIKFGANK